MAECVQSCGQGFWKSDCRQRSAKTFCGKTRAIRRQLKNRRRILELIAPIGQLLVEQCLLHAFSLPGGKIRILHRQFRKRRGAARNRRIVQRGQLVREHAHRPAVAHNVMNIQEQYVLATSDVQQSCTQ